MQVSNDQIRQQVTELINSAGRSPFLFLGSGFSRRYLGTESWDGLLRSLGAFYSDDPFLLESYRLRLQEQGLNSGNPAVASLMEKDLKKAVLGNPSLSQFRDEHADSLRQGESLLKIVAALHLSAFKKTLMNGEIAKLRRAGERRIAGVITTNYDNLIEDLFPEFVTFVGQEDLLFRQLYETGEIYKIHGSISVPQSIVLNAEDYEALKGRQEYLVAKLLTIFVEYPIVFIGYSVSDPDIRSILMSLAKCLDSAHLAILKDRFIFVVRGENEVSKRSIDFEGLGAIDMTQISTDDFGLIYEGIGDAHSRYAPRVLRDLKKSIYELVEQGNPGSRVNVTGIDGLDALPDSSEIIIGVGALPKDAIRHAHMPSPELLFRDVVFDNEGLMPSLVIEEYLPELLKSYGGSLPVYKYLSLYPGEVTDFRTRKLIRDKHRVEDFLNSGQKKLRRNYRQAHLNISMQSIISEEGFTDAYKKLYYLEDDEVNVVELRSYLKRLIKENPGILKGNSELKRLIRIYDFLKYKDASVTMANSESIETPSQSGEA